MKISLMCVCPPISNTEIKSKDDSKKKTNHLAKKIIMLLGSTFAVFTTGTLITLGISVGCFFAHPIAGLVTLITGLSLTIIASLAIFLTLYFCVFRTKTPLILKEPALAPTPALTLASTPVKAQKNEIQSTQKEKHLRSNKSEKKSLTSKKKNLPSSQVQAKKVAQIPKRVIDEIKQNFIEKSVPSLPLIEIQTDPKIKPVSSKTLSKSLAKETIKKFNDLTLSTAKHISGKEIKKFAESLIANENKVKICQLKEKLVQEQYSDKIIYAILNDWHILGHAIRENRELLDDQRINEILGHAQNLQKIEKDNDEFDSQLNLLKIKFNSGELPARKYVIEKSFPFLAELIHGDFQKKKI